jgi:alkaline phosphatase D
LWVEVADDAAFKHVVATSDTGVSDVSDWTTRVLVGGLKPSHIYWYRFVDEAGNGSRVGRTITAPLVGDTSSKRFAFVSCQSVNEGAERLSADDLGGRAGAA